MIHMALEYVPHKMPTKGAVWLTEKTLQIAEKRREAKAKGELDEARRLHADFQHEARIDNVLNARCISLEEAFRNGRIRELFATVKQVKTPFSARQSTIKDRDGNELTDQQDSRRDGENTLKTCTLPLTINRTKIRQIRDFKNQIFLRAKWSGRCVSYQATRRLASTGSLPNCSGQFQELP